jgi:hypothetical protein
MKIWSRIICLASIVEILGTLMSPSIAADDTADTLRRFGLVGVFSDDCSVNVSQGGAAYVWGSHSGRLFLTATMDNGTDRILILSAQRITANRLYAREAPENAISGFGGRNPQIEEVIYEKVGSSDYRTVKLVVDGVLVLDADNGIGARMAVLKKCSEDRNPLTAQTIAEPFQPQSTQSCEQVRVAAVQFCNRLDTTPFSNGVPSGCNYVGCTLDIRSYCVKDQILRRGC